MAHIDLNGRGDVFGGGGT